MNYKICKIISKNDLQDSLNFNHSNNFSLKTNLSKISLSFDKRILGLMIKDSEKIIGNIYYYYQPDFDFMNQTYKVVNFATIFVDKSYRGKGISKLMLNKTLEIFKGYIITDYTPVGSIMHILKKLNFGFMQNYRNLILPIPTIKLNFFKHIFGKLTKVNDKEVIFNNFKNLEKYRQYEIDMWSYTFANETILLGVINRVHFKKLGFLKLKLRSKRVLWTNNEDLLLKYSNNISFKFSLLNKTQFITIDTKKNNKPFFSIQLKNQFMMYPKLHTKVPTVGSEFFSNNL